MAYNGYTEAQKRAILTYRKKSIDRIAVDCPAGTKELWKEYADAAGMSLAALIKEAVEEKAARDGLKLPGGADRGGGNE